MGNGFEMWRRLYIDYQGGSTAVELCGVRRLQEFPKCQSIGKLSEHLDDWLDVLTTYGTELEHCPRLLRNMVLSIIPKSLEDEILDEGDDPKFRSYTDIIRLSDGVRERSPRSGPRSCRNSPENLQACLVLTPFAVQMMSPIRTPRGMHRRTCPGKA